MAEKVVHLDAREPERKTRRRIIVGDQFDEGGMALIVDAIDTNLMRTIAMKVLRKELAKEEHQLAKMVEETQIMAQLDHPNIVPVYEMGLDKEKRLFYTMKKVEGKALDLLIYDQDLSSRTDSDLYQMIQIMLKVCDVVSYAHSRGVLHRDLKPPNIMVGDFGQVYLMDWGNASVTDWARSTAENLAIPKARKRKKYRAEEERQGSFMGSACYMAPEQVAGDLEAIGERSDVFALGVILYEILTCTRPIEFKSYPQVKRDTLACEIPPPEEKVDVPLPPGLGIIAMKALRKDPEERFQSVGELRDALERFLEGGWHFPARTYRPGEMIVREGDEGNEAYLIRSGECRVFRMEEGEEIDMRTMGPGDYFGELALLTDKSRSASIEALTDVTVSVFTKKHFEEELGLGAWLGGFVRTLAERFREVEKRAEHFESLAKQGSA